MRFKLVESRIVPDKKKSTKKLDLDEALGLKRKSRLTETKHDLYINGDYVASSNRYKRAKDFKDKVTKDGYIEYAGEKALRSAGTKLDRRDINPNDKIRVRRAKNESLKDNEVDEFFNKAKKLGVTTLGDLKKLLTQEPETRFGSDIYKMRKYSKYANPEDKELKNESLKEDFNQESIKTEIEKAIRDYFKHWDDEDYNDMVKDYLAIEVVPTNDGRTKVEVRAELTYGTLSKIADKLDPIVQKIDKDAYFDFEDDGIINAYLNTELVDSLEEKLYQINIDGEDMGTFDNEEDAYREKDRLNDPRAEVIEIEDDWDNDDYDRRAVEQEYGLEDGELDGVDIRDAEEMIGEEEGALDRFVYEFRDALEEKLIQGKSEDTLKKNIETEIKSGKSPKQAYAIAKSVQKKNMKEEFEEEADYYMSDDEDNLDENVGLLAAVPEIVGAIGTALEVKDIADELTNNTTESMQDEEYVDIYDNTIHEDEIVRDDIEENEDDLSDSHIQELAKKAIEENAKRKKPMQNSKVASQVKPMEEEMVVDKATEINQDEEEVVEDYVSPNAVDPSMKPQEVDLNNI